MKKYVICHECNERHVAEPSHISASGHQLYAVVCTKDSLTDYYTDEAIVCEKCVMPGIVEVFGKWSDTDAFETRTFCMIHAQTALHTEPVSVPCDDPEACVC